VKSPIGSFSIVATPTRIAEPVAGDAVAEHGADTPVQLTGPADELELPADEELSPAALDVELPLLELLQALSVTASAAHRTIHVLRLRLVGRVTLVGLFIDERHLRVGIPGPPG
jgi:hypothetical protein